MKMDRLKMVRRCQMGRTDYPNGRRVKNAHPSASSLRLEYKHLINLNGLNRQLVQLLTSS
jgi:hypothetical protein